MLSVMLIFTALPLEIAAREINDSITNEPYEIGEVDGKLNKIYTLADFMSENELREFAKEISNVEEEDGFLGPVIQSDPVRGTKYDKPTEEVYPTNDTPFKLKLAISIADRFFKKQTIDIYFGNPIKYPDNAQKIAEFNIDATDEGADFNKVIKYYDAKWVEGKKEYGIEKTKKSPINIYFSVPFNFTYDFTLASTKTKKTTEYAEGREPYIQFNVDMRQSVMHGYSIKWLDSNKNNRDNVSATWYGKQGDSFPATLKTIDSAYSVYNLNQFDPSDKKNIVDENGETYTPHPYYLNKWDPSADGGVGAWTSEKIVTRSYQGTNIGVFQAEKLVINDTDTAPQAGLYVDGASRQGSKTLKNNKKYFYESTGDYKTLHVLTMREALKVKFNTGNGKLNENGSKNADIGDAQEIGYEEKLKDNQAGGKNFDGSSNKAREITVPDGSTLIPPAAAAGEPTNEFKGWALGANDTTALFTSDSDAKKYTNEFKKDTTFYAIYGPKAQGKVTIQYVDKSGTAIKDIYKVQGVDYPKFADGNIGKDVDVKSIPEPKFIGYKRSGVIVVTGKKYDENGRDTVEVPYEKLDSIIPEKDGNGNENPKVTDDVKKHYAKVTFQVAAADDAKAKLQLDSADAKSPLVYYVNPVEGIAIKNVAKVNAVSKDTNLYKVDTNDMWTYDPNTITGTDYKIVQAKDTQNKVVKTEITLTAKVADKTAAKFKDKLKPVDIKVWEDKTDTDGSKIDWKKGVELKESNTDLKTILDKAETKVTDQSNRNSSKQNLPEGKEGTLKVTFSDGSSLNVENQKLYVSPLKVPVKPGEENQIDPDKLPNDKLAVEFKLGEGVKIGDKEGNKTTPVLYTTYYVKPGTDLKGDVPTVSAKEGYKDAKWYKGDAVATDGDYKVTANAVFTAKATGKDKVVKLDDPENPTNFPKDPTDNNKKDADYVTVKFVADANGKIKEGDTEKAKGIAYAVLKNTEWADALTAGVVVPEVDAEGNAPKLVGKDKFYSFKEWQKDGAKVSTFAKVVADVTYTAAFGKADEFSVTYDLNAPEGLTVGGTAPTDTDKYLEDEKVTVKALAADNTLAGYEFTGWNTKADGKGTAYAANAKFAIKANTDLFAQWKKTAKDVIPVDSENDKKGKNGEEIPTNYVFVEFKVKDADADKAEIKANQQSKFKVDPKAAVTLTAPALELKGNYKDSHIASFNKADYTNKKFEQKTIIWAVVTEKGKVKVNYVFKTDPADKTLPKALADLKPIDITNPIYEDKVVDPDQPDTSSEAAQKALVEKDKDGKEVGTWTPGAWVKSGKVEDGLLTYTLTWTFTKPGEPYKYLTLTLDENYRGGRVSDYDAYQGDLIEGYLYRPHRRGYVFEGWSYNSRRLDEVRPGDRIYYPITLYAIWSKQKPKDDEEVEPIDTREVGEHKAYMFGYTDGTVRPNGYITRAEAAALVTRLLGLDTFASAAEPAFTDTPSSWYNKAINAAVARGIMKGYPDKSFRPNAPITRAEFTQMISTIDNKPYGVAPFADVVGHWAERPIGSEYQAGRIKGYPDGTFRPNAFITRAEAVVILNKIFERNYDAMSAMNAKNKEYIKRFIDLAPSFWGFNDMVEATNTHLFKRRVKGSVQEDWVEVK